MKKKSLSALFQPVELTQGECWKTILAFSFPIIVSYLLQQVYTISDAAIVGQTLTAQEVAGVNDTTSLIFIFLQFAFGVSAGFCVVTSCNVGAHNPAGVRRSLTTQIVLSAALTVILTVLALLLLALPLARRDTSLHVRGAVSTPYLDMTLDTAARFGIEISQRDYEEFYIPGRQRYRSTYFSIEGDWSAAAMLLVAGATAGEVTVRNVSMLSKQADTAVCTALVRAGAAVINEADSVTAISRPLHGFEFDATNCPDLFPALAALAAAADGVSTIRGTSRLLHKESNRAEAIREEYAKVGIEVDISEEDVMRIRGGKIRPARFSSHDDHRMAMSMAVSALRCDGQITIENAECVAKSYPGFFEDLEKIRI